MNQEASQFAENKKGKSEGKPQVNNQAVGKGPRLCEIGDSQIPDNPHAMGLDTTKKNPIRKPAAKGGRTKGAKSDGPSLPDPPEDLEDRIEACRSSTKNDRKISLFFMKNNPKQLCQSLKDWIKAAQESGRKSARAPNNLIHC